MMNSYILWDCLFAQMYSMNVRLMVREKFFYGILRIETENCFIFNLELMIILNER